MAKNRFSFFKTATANTLTNAICTKNKLRVELSTGSHCYFPKGVKEDCYYYALTVLWIDGSGRCTHRTIETEWIGKKDALPQYELCFERPQWASQYLLLLGVQAAGSKDRWSNFRQWECRL